LEIYRRLVAPYEDKKIEENGDVEWLCIKDFGVLSVNVTQYIIGKIIDIFVLMVK
jgi:hypothetical protein